ncbi:MAG TPA: hypothetical protein VFE67_16935 [Rudaea sp.]|nr:hypothetical protein [Rudaea sp.]
MRVTLFLFATLLWSAATGAPPDAAATQAQAQSLLPGTFDNAAQVAKAPTGAEQPVPHVTVRIEQTPQKDFSLWHVRIQTDAESTFEQTWAMQTRIEHDGSGALIPYYQLHQDSVPSAAAFDGQGWLSLEACALRGNFTQTRLQGMAEGEPCVAVSMSVGARRALLPVSFAREGEWLHLDMNLRSVRTHIDAKRSP